MKTKKQDVYTIVQVTIKVKYGSEFQKEYMRDSLDVLLKAWGQSVGATHKKNEVGIFYDRNELRDGKKQ